MEIKSPAFSQGEAIPKKYTCDGNDLSPPLKWDSIPAGTKSFALISDDPDAPAGTWIHWVYFDIPPTVKELPEAVSKEEHPAQGGIQGITDFRKIGYGGPCPPSGIHRYYFKLYALDIELKLKAGASKQQVIDAMQGHILEKAELMGKYSR